MEMASTTLATGHGERATWASADIPIADWLWLIRAEYLEFPTLRLTKPQVQRLWNIDQVTCDVLLSALVDVGFLKRTRQGAYVRADVG
jgi:hypothetical protein